MGVLVRIDGNTEAILKSDQMLQSDTYRPNDRIKALLINLSADFYGPIINLSRTNNQFVLKLFEQNVPEVEDNIIEIKAIAREPYSRTKIAVYSNDSSIDPVGACVGIRGSRVRSIISELREEKIDIIHWSEDPAKLTVNALGDIIKIFVDKVNKEIEAVVPDDKLSQAIGRKGQNIKLISELIGWKIDIRSETVESERRKKEFKTSTDIITMVLDVELILAQILVSEGFDNVYKIASASVQDISKIEGVDEETSEELIARAKNYLDHNKH
jgi:N utilization substance protein A